MQSAFRSMRKVRMN